MYTCKIRLRCQIILYMYQSAKAYKGILSRDEYFLKAYNNKYVLSVHARKVLQFFCVLVHEKINLKFMLVHLKLLSSFENLSRNPLQRP
jgi:hypothetical protein